MWLQGEYAHTGKEWVMLRSCIDTLFQIAERAGASRNAASSPASRQESSPEVRVLRMTSLHLLLGILLLEG